MAWSVDRLTLPLETPEERNRRLAGEMQVPRRMTRRQAAAAQAAAQARAKQEVREAALRGVQYPSQ